MRISFLALTSVIILSYTGRRDAFVIQKTHHACSAMDVSAMIIIGAGFVEKYLANARTHDETAVLRSHYRAWLLVVGQSQWRSFEEIKQSYPKASILDGDLVAFGLNEGNYVLIGRVHYAANVFAIQFFGTPADYDRFKGEAIDGRSANFN